MPRCYLALIAIAALTLSACGDSSGNPQTALPRLTWGAVSATEGNASEESEVTFAFNLNKEAVNASIDYITLDGSARRDLDYRFSSGTLHFADLSRTQTLAIPLVGDAAIEGDENFILVLGNAVNLSFDVSSYYATIVDDDFPTTISVSSTPTTEGANTAILFTASIDNLVDQVTFAYSTVNGSALAGEDYNASSGVIEFTPGLSQEIFSVPLLNDDIAEPDEQFSLTLSAPQNADFAATEISATIIDDDNPVLTIQDNSITEGNLHQYQQMTFTLRIESLAESASVAYELQSYSAIAGEDFISDSGNLSFDESLEQYIVVDIYGDHEVESTEQFLVLLSSPQNLRLESTDATGTIYDNDERATLLIATSTATEPDNLESSELTLTFSLNEYTEGIGIAYQTLDREALAGIDYESATGVWNMTYDQLRVERTLQIVGDQIADGDETFLLEISAVTGADYDAESMLTLSINDDNDDIAAECLSSDSSLDFGTVQINTEYSRTLSLHNSCDYSVQLDRGNHPLPEALNFGSQDLYLEPASSADWEVQLYAEAEGNISGSALAKFDIRAAAVALPTPPYYAGAAVAGRNALGELEGAYALQYGQAANEVYVSGFFGDALLVFSADDLSLKQRLVHGEYGYSNLDATTWIEYNEAYDEVLVFGGSLSYPFVVFKRDQATGLFYQAQIASAESWEDVNDLSISQVNSSAGLLSADGNDLVLVADNDPRDLADDLLVVYQRDNNGNYNFRSQTNIGEDSAVDWDTSARMTSYLAWVERDSGGDLLFVSRSIGDKLQMYLFKGDASMELRQEFAHGEGGIDAMDGPKQIAISSDLNFVYVTASTSGAINIFQLQTDDNYAFLASFAGDAEDANLTGVRSLVLSPREDQLLINTRDDPAGIAVLERNSDSGLLSSLVQVNNLNQSNVPGLDQSMMVELNQAGDRVFLSQYNGHALHAFDRDRVSGLLFFDQVALMSATSEAFQDLHNPTDVVFDSERNYLYALSPDDNAVSVLATSDAGIEAWVNSYDSDYDGYLETPTQLELSADGEHLLVLSTGQETIAVFAAAGGDLSLSSAFEFVDHDLLAGYYPQSITMAPENQQLIVLIGDGLGGNKLLTLEFDSSSGTLSAPELIDDEKDISGTESLLLTQDASKLYAIITGDADNEDYGELIVFDRDPSSGALSYLESRIGLASGSNGLRNAVSMAESPDGYIFISGQAETNQGGDVNTISVLNSDLELLYQYYQGLSILANDDVAVAAIFGKIILYSTSGDMLTIYDYFTDNGEIFTSEDLLSLEENIGGGSWERGIAGIADVVVGGDYLYTAGSSSQAVGSIKFQ